MPGKYPYSCSTIRINISSVWGIYLRVCFIKLSLNETLGHFTELKPNGIVPRVETHERVSTIRVFLGKTPAYMYSFRSIHTLIKI